jgi:uncharacterized protein YdeI (YjbR/CyaY-like superfamily)
MPKKDPRVDAYIAKAAPFAQPVLRHLRKLVHTGCPDVEETLKWSMPSFTYKGILCGMAAFKEHCTFGFWKHDLVVGAQGAPKAEEAMGTFGRITKLSDLPSNEVLLGYVRKAVELNDAGIKKPASPKKPREELKIPSSLMEALKRNKKALETFEEFSYSHKKEYVEWITEAKRDETRDKRLATAIAWIAEGKPRNWKYANC